MALHARHRKDTNHGDIITAFQRNGWKVIDTSQGGPLDIIAYDLADHTRWAVVEIKSGKEKLTPREAQFIIDHPKVSHIARNAGDVSDIIHGYRKDIEAINEAGSVLFKRKTASYG